MRRWLPLAVLALCSVLPASAGATTFDVINERGIPQATYYFVNDSNDGYFLGSADGRTEIDDLVPGDIVRFSRSPRTGECAGPEGEGVSYLVPDPPEPGATIVLPVASGDSYRPENSDAERWIIGKLNQRRAERGLPPLRASASLNRAADAVAHDSALKRAATGTFPFPPPFCDVIHIDWGWPGGSGFTILDQKGEDPRSALEHWTDGSVREQSGTLGDWDSVGVGDGGPGGAFIAYFSRCPERFAARCELSEDQGDPNIVLPAAPAGLSNPPPGGSPQPGGQNAKPVAGEVKGTGPARAKVNRRLRFPSTIGASCAASSGCYVTADAVAKTKVLARRGFRLAQGKARPVKLTLSTAGRKALRRAGHLRLVITVTLKATGHEAAVTKRTVTVTAPRR